MDNRLQIALRSAALAVMTGALAIVVRITARHRMSAPLPPDLVVIPAGVFIMGSEADDPDARPVHTVHLESFAISRYEVTNAQFAHFLNTNNGTTPRCGDHICVDTQLENPSSHLLSRQGRYVAQERYERHPVTNVSWYGARAYCQHLGMRLPTEAEWEKAARGTSGRAYPWGNVADPARLNAGNRVGDTTPVGSYVEGASPYGLYDMAGNVWEWTADWYEAYPGNPYQTALFGKKVKVVRGGSWNHPDDDARAAHRDIAHPARRIHVVGFRCAGGAD
jgi:formylglycine-generating enzyme required for sulfatase activity